MVYKKQIGAYIPRKDDKHWANRYFADKSLETLLPLARRVLEHVVADLEQIFGPLDGGGYLLGRVGDGTSHLDGELIGKLILPVGEDLEGLLDDDLAVSQLRCAPCLERLGGNVGNLLEILSGDAVARKDGFLGGGGDGGDDLDRHGDGR